MIKNHEMNKFIRKKGKKIEIIKGIVNSHYFFILFSSNIRKIERKIKKINKIFSIFKI